MVRSHAIAKHAVESSGRFNTNIIINQTIPCLGCIQLEQIARKLFEAKEKCRALSTEQEDK